MTRTSHRSSLNVGVVGIGRMGQRHALNILHNIPQAKLLCGCSPAKQDLIWAAEHLEPYGVKVFPTFEDMIEGAPGLQAVVIASATFLHREHAMMALNKGIHVLCEKPVCETVEELRELVELVESKPKTKFMVGFTRRFDESNLDAYQKIQQGTIGTPMVFRSQGCEKLDTSDFYKQYLKASGGIFIDSTIHEIDLSLLMFGEDSKPRSVSAVGIARVHEELSVDSDADNAVGICEFWDGKIAYYYSSRTAAHGYDNSIEIFGTAGKLSVNMVPRQNRLEICDAGGIKIEPTPGWYDRYRESFVTEIDSWVTAILEDKLMPIPIRSCLTSLVIAMALQESLKTRERINFTREGFRETARGRL